MVLLAYPNGAQYIENLPKKSAKKSDNQSRDFSEYSNTIQTERSLTYGGYALGE
jgi:hypothetical protein